MIYIRSHGAFCASFLISESLRFPAACTRNFNQFGQLTEVSLNSISKAELIRRIKTSHRQLERYLFYPVDFSIPPALGAKSIQGILSEFKDSFGRVVTAIESVSETDLFDPDARRTGSFSLADLVVFSTYTHYEWAKGLIRTWRKRHAGKYLNKLIILERIQTEHRRLEGVIDALSYEQMQANGVVGEWSVKDILAHLSAWEGFFLCWYETGLCGELPEIPAPGFGWEEIDALNRHVYEEAHDRPLEEVLEDFRESYKRTLAAIELIPEDEMFKPGLYAWLGEGALAGYILANTAKHYRWAKKQVRRWLEDHTK